MNDSFSFNSVIYAVLVRTENEGGIDFGVHATAEFTIDLPTVENESSLVLQGVLRLGCVRLSS